MLSSANLRRLLQPRSIAFLGGRHAELALRQSRAIGFKGEVWPVNPNRKSLAGLPCYPSIADLPAAPDAALVAVPAEASIQAVAELAARGAGGAVCFATGFAETGAEGRARQERLIEAAGDLALVGPNCIGILNYLDGAALWPDEQGGEGCDRGAAILSQSGNVAINLTMQDRSLPLAYVISLGNQAGLGIADYIEGMLDDPRVTAIGIYLEQLLDVPAFERAALQALERAIPIVVLKLGASEAGARSVMSHTSALAGSDALYEALFKRLGVLRVESPAALVETLKLFTVGGVPEGPCLISLSCSGGEAALVGDLVAARGLPLQFPQPAPDRRERLAKQLRLQPDAIGNPLDYNTLHWGDAGALRPAFAEAVQGHDLALLLLDYPHSDRCNRAAWEASEEAFAAAVRDTRVLPAVVSSLPESFPATARRRLIEQGVVPLQGLDEALAALAAAADYGTSRPRLLAHPPPPLLAGRASAPTPHALDEADAKRLLKDWGLAVPESFVGAAEEVAEAAAAMSGRLVLKALAPGLAHKTEVGAVALDLRDRAQVTAALDGMKRRLASHGLVAERFLLERLVEDVVAEVILGIQQSPPFGPSLLIGSGGILAELVGDTVSLLLPTEEASVRDALARLKVARLLAGWRGQPTGDLDALVQAVLTLARFAEAHADHLVECDINPLLVRPRGLGAVVADALIVRR